MHVSRGETIIIETQDCFGGRLTEDPATHNCLDKDNHTPVTGPIYIEGASIGDVLCIYIQKIDIASNGLVVLKPKRGTLGKDVRQTSVRQVAIQNNMVEVTDSVSLPVAPVIGCIGVAPRHGEITTMYPGRHGGNMDTKDITEGTRVFLPVQVKGGMFSLGDVKACMGDGASIGGGVEVAAEITARFDILPGGHFSWPRLETSDAYVTVTSASSVGQASRLAVMEMVRWLEQEKGLDFDTAYVTVGLSGNLMVSQWFNPLITARLVFPKQVMRKIQNRDPLGARAVFPPNPILPEEEEPPAAVPEERQQKVQPSEEPAREPETQDAEEVAPVTEGGQEMPVVSEDTDVSISPPSTDDEQGEKERKPPTRRRRRRYRRRPSQSKKSGENTGTTGDEADQNASQESKEDTKAPKPVMQETAKEADDAAAEAPADAQEEGATDQEGEIKSKPPSRRRRTWRRRNSRSSTRRRPRSSSSSESEAKPAADANSKEDKPSDDVKPSDA